MQLLTQKESDLVKTFALALKMNHHRSMVDYFKRQYEANPYDVEHAFNYGVCMSVYIGCDPDSTSKSKHQFVANKTFTECLNQREDWWFARYLRSMVNLELSDGLVSMSESFNAEIYQKSDPELDWQILLEQQTNSPVQLPYFLCPFLYQAKSSIYKGLIDRALERVRSGMQAIPVVPVVYANSFLIQPCCDLIILLRKLEIVETAEELKRVALTLFPTAKILLMT